MTSTINWQQLAEQIKVWGQQLGFQQIGITDTDLTSEEPKLQQWLDAGFHGEMDYICLLYTSDAADE